MAVDTVDGRQDRVLVPVGSSKNPKLRWQAQAARTLSEVCAASLLSSTELVAVLQHTTGQSILPSELDQWQEGQVEFPAWIIPAITDVAGLQQEDGRWVLRGQQRERSRVLAALTAPLRLLWRGRGAVATVMAGGLLVALLYAGHHYLGYNLRLPTLPTSHPNAQVRLQSGTQHSRARSDSTILPTPDSQTGAPTTEPTPAPSPTPAAPPPTAAPIQSSAAAPAGSAPATQVGTAATAQQSTPAQPATARSAAPAQPAPQSTQTPAAAPASGSPGGLLGLLGGLLSLLGL